MTIHDMIETVEAAILALRGDTSASARKQGVQLEELLSFLQQVELRTGRWAKIERVLNSIEESE